MTPYLRAGIPGDFRPFACLEPDGRLTGHDVELLEALAREAGMELRIVPTDWTGLAEGLGRDYEVAAGGVSITPEREARGDFLPAYAPFWKTGIVRREALGRFRSPEDLNDPSVTVIKNPGGTNERWVDANLTRARVILEPDNVAIPSRVAAGDGDLMVTDITEARHYAALDERLAVLPFPLTPVQTKGIWMAKGWADASRLRNAWTRLEEDDTLRRLLARWELEA